MDNSRALMLSIQETTGLGKVFVESGFFSDTKQAAQAVVKILAGRELGFGPVASMAGIYIVKGRIMLSATLMAARIKASGRYDYRVRENSNTACEIEFLEKSGSAWTGIGTSRFTMQDAVSAQLANGDNWRKFPRNMLMARAMSNGAKWYCPDLFSGAPIYTPEEMGVPEGVNPETGEVMDGDHDDKDSPEPQVIIQPEPESKPASIPEAAPVAPATIKVNGTINGPKSLLDAVNAIPDARGYYDDEKDPTAVLMHLRGGICKYLGNPNWKWPLASDKDAWKEAFDAAVTYAREARALEALEKQM